MPDVADAGAFMIKLPRDSRRAHSKSGLSVDVHF
jgi:hypothetical protein